MAMHNSPRELEQLTGLSLGLILKARLYTSDKTSALTRDAINQCVRHLETLIETPASSDNMRKLILAFHPHKKPKEFMSDPNYAQLNDEIFEIIQANGATSTDNPYDGAYYISPVITKTVIETLQQFLNGQFKITSFMVSVKSPELAEGLRLFSLSFQAVEQLMPNFAGLFTQKINFRDTIVNDNPVTPQAQNESARIKQDSELRQAQNNEPQIARTLEFAPMPAIRAILKAKESLKTPVDKRQLSNLQLQLAEFLEMGAYTQAPKLKAEAEALLERFGSLARLLDKQALRPGLLPNAMIKSLLNQAPKTRASKTPPPLPAFHQAQSEQTKKARHTPPPLPVRLLKTVASSLLEAKSDAAASSYRDETAVSVPEPAPSQNTHRTPPPLPRTNKPQMEVPQPPRQALPDKVGPSPIAPTSVVVELQNEPTITLKPSVLPSAPPLAPPLGFQSPTAKADPLAALKKQKLAKKNQASQAPQSPRLAHKPSQAVDGVIDELKAALDKRRNHGMEPVTVSPESPRVASQPALTEGSENRSAISDRTPVPLAPLLVPPMAPPMAPPLAFGVPRAKIVPLRALKEQRMNKENQGLNPVPASAKPTSDKVKPAASIIDELKVALDRRRATPTSETPTLLRPKG